MRFSPRFLKVFFRLPAPSFFSGTAPSAAGSVLAIVLPSLSDCLLLRDCALARTLARAGVRARALPAHRQVAAVPHPPVTADFHQPLDVHGDLLAQISFNAALFFDHATDLPDVFLRQILDPDVRA